MKLPRLCHGSVLHLRAIGIELCQSWFKEISRGRLCCDTDAWPITKDEETWASHSQLVLAALALGSKSISSLQAVLVLHERDLGDDAIAIVRTMIEALGKLAWIAAKSWPKRLYEFRVVMALHDDRQWNALREDPTVRALAEEAGAVAPTLLVQEAKQRLGVESVARIEKNWPPAGVEQALRQLNLQHLYNGWYRTGSRVVHANDILDHASWSEELGFEANRRDHWTDMALAGAVGTAMETLNIVDRVLGLGLSRALVALRRQLEQVARSS